MGARLPLSRRPAQSTLSRTTTRCEKGFAGARAASIFANAVRGDDIVSLPLAGGREAFTSGGYGP